jgi:O-antigen ligase
MLVEIPAIFDYTLFMTLPEKPSLFYKVAKVTVSCLILGLPIIYIPGGYSDFRLPKELLFQAIAFILILSWILFLLYNNLFKQTWKQICKDKIFLLLLFFLMIACVSLFYHGTYALGKHQVINLCLAIFLYAVIRNTFKTKDIPFFINLFLFSAFIISVFTISQYIEFSREDWIIYRKDATYSLLGNSNTVGTYLMAAIPIALVQLRQVFSSRKKWLLIPFPIILLTIVAGLIYAQAGGAYIGLAVGLVFLGMLPINLKPLKWRSKHFKWILIATLGLVIVLYVTPVYDAIAFRMDKLKTGHYQEVLSHRWELWQAGFRLMRQKPIMGWGMGSFSLHAPEALAAWYAANPDAPTHPHYVMHAHNDYLEKGAEMGILAPVIMVIILGLFIRHLFKARKRYKEIENPDKEQKKAFYYVVGFGAGIVAFSINSLAHFPLHLAAVGFQLILFAALFMIAVDSIQHKPHKTIKKEIPEPGPQKPRLLFQTMWKTFVLVPLFLAGIALFTGIHSRLFWNVHLGRGVRLLEAALKERQTSTKSAEIRFRQSIHALSKAKQHQPDNGTSHYYLGIAYLSLRMGPEALEAFNTAEKTYRRPELYYGRAQVWFHLFNNKERAEQDYKKALRLKPDFREARQALERQRD